MNNMLIDIQVCNFINVWRQWDNGDYSVSLVTIPTPNIKSFEFNAALRIAKRQYSERNK